MVTNRRSPPIASGPSPDRSARNKPRSPHQPRSLPRLKHGRDQDPPTPQVAAANTRVRQPGQDATPPGGMPSRAHPLTHWTHPAEDITTRGHHKDVTRLDGDVLPDPDILSALHGASSTTARRAESAIGICRSANRPHGV
jgi:hypothetical protein